MRRDTLLIVDDEEVNRAILRAQFESQYDFMEAENGEQAMMLIRQYRDCLAGILLDLVMPVKNGYEVLKEMTQCGLMTNIPVIVITSDESTENEVRAFDMGAADIIIKPFEPHVVRRRVQNAVELNRHKLHLEEMVEEQAAKLRESRDVIMDALSSVIEHRSAETGQHVLRIRMFTKVLLEEVMRCCPEYDLSRRAIGVIAETAALHDVGKIAIPDTILNKPGKLTPEEYEIMKTHTMKGCEILKGLERMGDQEYLTYAYNICRYHHERWDGSGYPDGLAGDNVPVYAQAVGIADCYDALTTDRIYRKALLPRQAATMILNGECGPFSPRLLECFKNIGEQFEALVHSCADGQPLKQSSGTVWNPGPSGKREAQAEPEVGQTKYFTLLRFLNCTVMEVDLNRGIYHLVYRQNEDFQTLPASEVFEEAFKSFVAQSVHPDDRSAVLALLDSYIDDFYGRGLMKRTGTCRVLHCATGEYIQYEATALRVNFDSPKEHKILIVWKILENSAEEPVLRSEAVGVPAMQNLPVGIRQCLSDRWFTITYINRGFTALFGYSEDELRTRFHNHFMEMIHPEDQQAVRRRFLEQVRSSGVLELEYRVISKQGIPVWVLDKCRLAAGEDGREYLNCVLTDITQVKQAQEQQRLDMERCQIILNQTNDIIFEWDIQGDKITYSPNWEKLFGYQPLATSEEVQTVSHILPEDMPQLIKLMKDTENGAPYGEAELRIANDDGKYLWCRIRETTQYNSAGKAVKAVGVILNIDAEKRQAQALVNRAERDSLTQLYNKATANEKIRRLLEEKGDSDQFAMLLIDLDNFKQINDSRGHMFGDLVLAEAAARLKALFDSGDILARFGGDEFLIFLKYRGGKETLSRKAGRIVDALHRIYEDELSDCSLTCSVGIARCPEDGEDFQTIFQQSDQALHQVKKMGKNSFAFYDRTVMKKVFGLDISQLAAAGTRIESDDTACRVDSLVLQSFQMLYESRDVETAVNAILEMAGRKYGASRAYIFEDSGDGSWTRNTFEWCNEGISPAQSGLQQVAYAALGEDYRANFDENGIFYCHDIQKLPKWQYELLASQGVRSLLQCSVRDRGRFMGFVGFDDCALKRTWVQEQIDALIFISELIATFLLKKRAQDRTEAGARNLRMILDNQNTWIYVIDPDTCVLHFINAKTKRTVPEARVGMCCYEAFFHRDSPCEQCPAKDIRENVNRTLEVYNPVLGIWSMADASLIRWGEQDACLLACYDLSGYKKAKPQVQGKEAGDDGSVL